MLRRWEQLRAMLRKNWLFSLRGWKTLLLQVSAPLIFTLLLLLMDLIPKNPDENPYNPFPEELDPPKLLLGPVPPCLPFNDLSCVSIRYALNSSDPLADRPRMELVMDKVLRDNSLPPEEVEEMPSAEALVQWLAAHPNTTTHALIFHSLAPSSSSYTLLFNATLTALSLYDIRRKPDGRNELQVSVDRALMSVHLGREVNVEVQYKQFPQLGYQTGQSVTAQYGTIFFFSGIMFQYVLLLYNVCVEKDLSLRRGLKVVGLKDSIYWLSWLISATAITLLAVVVLLISGHASRLDYFTNTDVSVNFAVFFLYSMALISLAFFSSVFIQKAKSSLNLGMGVFVLGLLFVSIVGNTYTQQALYDDDLVTRAVPIIFQFIPPFNLAKAMADINDAAASYDTTGIPKNSTRYTWDRLYEDGCIPKNENGEIYCKPMPATIYALYYLIMNFFVFGFFTWYLDQVLPGSHGEPRPFYFFLTPSYWGLRTSKNDEESKLLGGPSAPAIYFSERSGDTDDPDVRAEKLKVRSNPLDYPCSIMGLEKVYKSFSFKSLFTCRPTKSFKAVDGVDLGVEESQLLALLGHNGAGKTTTINILTGLLSSTAGECYLGGLSIKEDMDQIREIIGVCPQHDILWNDLTAQEHMEIFCRLRCIPSDRTPALIRERLEDVQLWDVRNNAVGSFSGGMKRRLSVALAFISDPKIVFLDEPTTGMDPYVRRDVWNLILRLKKGRVVIMTTHSMEEADVLGDKIAIMALGKLMALGTSTQLKNRYAGYKVTAMASTQRVQEVTALFAEKLPEAVKEREVKVENLHTLTYELPSQHTQKLVGLLRVLEGPDSPASDFSVSQTTLQEVFLNVTGHTEYVAQASKEVK